MSMCHYIFHSNIRSLWALIVTCRERILHNYYVHFTQNLQNIFITSDDATVKNIVMYLYLQ